MNLPELIALEIGYNNMGGYTKRLKLDMSLVGDAYDQDGLSLLRDEMYEYMLEDNSELTSDNDKYTAIEETYSKIVKFINSNKES